MLQRGRQIGLGNRALSASSKLDPSRNSAFTSLQALALGYHAGVDRKLHTVPLGT
jgi:hypothetical protein